MAKNSPVALQLTGAATILALDPCQDPLRDP